MKKYPDDDFAAPVTLKLLDGYKWKLVESFDFYLDAEKQCKIVIPAGYVTDLASVPRFLWWWLPPHGRYAKAAIIHDYMYDNAIACKAVADSTFYKAMRMLGVPRTKATLMYLAVRLFGRGRYKH